MLWGGGGVAVMLIFLALEMLMVRVLLAEHGMCSPLVMPTARAL